MSNEEILAELNKGMTALHNGIRNVNQALSSSNIAVGQAEAYNKGLNDAWEFVRKLTTLVGDGGMSAQEWESIYKTKTNRIIDEYTPQEALAKLEAYEKKIEVGDVVRLKGSDKEYVVTTIDEDRCSEIYCGVSKDGRWFSQCNVEKTGKHIDIQSALQQIGE